MPLREDLAILRFEKTAQTRQRMSACCIQLEHSLCDRRVVMVNLNSAQQFIIPVAGRRPAGVNALRCFLPHSLAYFIPQVLDLVPRDYTLTTVDALGPVVRVVSDVLPF